MHKHSALLLVLRAQKLKKQAIHYFETHAGRAQYDLHAAQARKTQEAAQGILQILGVQKTDPSADKNLNRQASNFSRYLEINQDPRQYFGSPALAAQALRAQDRLLLSELHPQEFKALKAWSATDKRIACIQQDGYKVAQDLPLDPRLLVFIDPSYEFEEEYEKAAQLALDLYQNKQATVLLWYPILKDRRQNKLLGKIKQSGLGAIAQDQVLIAPLRHKDSAEGQKFYGMQGSGLIVLSRQAGALRRELKANSAELAKALPAEREARSSSGLLCTSF